MYDESQSFIARFSGFFLFLIALLVVGFLVFLTVRSAQDNDGEGDLAVTTSETTVAEDGTVQSTDDNAVAANTQAEQASDDEGVVAAPDDEVGLTSASSEGSSDSTVAADEGTVAGDAQELVNTGGEDLPNTGPAETLLAVIVLAVLGSLGYSYFRSQREFAHSLLD
ncbi:MAG: hypothetical protein R3313_03325 [Candidatus Saccharimonadales bacterium]|nr:hypothetical protein [Candidatus Saccharimonadales bacterium]